MSRVCHNKIQPKKTKLNWKLTWKTTDIWMKFWLPSLKNSNNNNKAAKELNKWDRDFTLFCNTFTNTKPAKFWSMKNNFLKKIFLPLNLQPMVNLFSTVKRRLINTLNFWTNSFQETFNMTSTTSLDLISSLPSPPLGCKSFLKSSRTYTLFLENTIWQSKRMKVYKKLKEWSALLVPLWKSLLKVPKKSKNYSTIWMTVLKLSASFTWCIKTNWSSPKTNCSQFPTLHKW